MPLRVLHQKHCESLWRFQDGLPTDHRVRAGLPQVFHVDSELLDKDKYSICGEKSRSHRKWTETI